ncbi:MAG TPA: FlgD immunoglobulin-like domain containing protein [Candidatus Krumholzibacteriaceae bacterium]|nr:FlgD immunoglobulin-like domain containing protein [Candidatus Krumholzibacteriaceae bacterium]
MNIRRSLLLVLTLFFIALFSYVTGHTSEIAMVIDYPSISPNGDGIKDESPLHIELLSSFDTLVVTIENIAETEVFDTLLRGSNPDSGSYIYEWEGRDSSGTVLSDSEYLLKLYASRPDTVINIKRTVIVDTSPPYIHIDRIEPGVFSPDETDTTDKALIYYTVSEFNEGSRTSALITDPENNTEEITLDIHSDSSYCFKWRPETPVSGTYSISVMIEDLAGNAGTDQGHIIVDADSPEISFLTTVPRYTKHPPDSITGTIYDRSDIDSLGFTWKDSLVITPGSIYTSNDTTVWHIVIYDSVYSGGSYIEGDYSLEVYARDIFGQSSDNSISFEIDTTRPAPPVLAQPQSPVLKGEVVLSFNSLDAGADSVSIFRLFDGDTFTTTVSSSNSSPKIDLSEGENEIWAKVTDEAGNESYQSNHISVTYEISSRNLFPEAFREPDDFIISTSSEAGKVKIQIFDLSGEEVRTISETGPQTYFQLEWDLLSNDGEEVRNGAYLAVITVYYSNSKTVDKNFIAVVR